MLCSNRFSLAGSPSTCILDTAMVPVPSFLLILGSALVFLLKLHRSNHTPRPQPRWLHILYLFVVVVLFGMSVLELARLVAEGLGVGLLPATPTALAFVFSLLISQRNGRTTGISILFLSYFLILAIFLAIKTARLVQLDRVHPAKGSHYPTADQWLDNAVMVALLVVAIIIEGVAFVMLRRNSGYDPAETKA